VVINNPDNSPQFIQLIDFSTEKILNTMDSDSIYQFKKQKEEDPCDMDPDPGDILQPSWFRCIICTNHEVDRLILDYGRYFLLPISVLFWTLFLIF
jgi:hypothetical protein